MNAVLTQIMAWTRPAAPLLLAAGLAGCIVGPVQENIEHCPPVFFGMSWQQDDLAGDHNGTPGAVWDAGDGGFAWTNRWEDLSGLQVSEVRFQAGPRVAVTIGASSYQGPSVDWLHLDQDGVTTSVHGDVTAAEVASAFRRLAANVSSAPAAEIDAAAQAFAASRNDTGSRAAYPLDDKGKRFREVVIWGYSADMPGPLRVEALLDDLDAPAPQVWLAGGMLRVAPWHFQFTLPSWTLADGNVSLRLDERGHAAFAATPAGNQTAVREEAQAFAARQGLPRLAIDDVHVNGMAC